MGYWENQIFHFKGYQIIDIDLVFKSTNDNYIDILKNYQLPISFDFSKRNTKKLYTHAFILTLSEFIKNADNNFIFYSNTKTKDKFRTVILNKVKRIFSLKIWESDEDVFNFASKILRNDMDVVPSLEIFISKRRKINFQKAYKFLEKEGLIFLNEKYFNQIHNKMIMATH
jgi:hypothetical protein